MTPTLAIALAFAGHAPPCEQRAWIVEKIARREGFFHPGTLPQRLNNPGSIKYVGQVGASPGPHGFAMWDSAIEGWSALERLVAHKRETGENLRRAWAYLQRRYR